MLHALILTGLAASTESKKAQKSRQTEVGGFFDRRACAPQRGD
jgi:hypothetical protein